MNDLLLPLLALTLIALLAGCNDPILESTPESENAYTYSAPQYDMTFDVIQSSATDPSPMTTVDYSYDIESGSLHITHSNVLLPNDPSRINVRIDIEDNILTIVEEGFILRGETGRYYDIDMEITGVTNAVYRILFVEPNSTENDLPLTFRMNFAEAVQGSVSRPQPVIEAS